MATRIHSALLGWTLALTLAGESRAAVDVITFDEQSHPAPPRYDPIPDGYHSLDWDNFDFAVSASISSPSGYINGDVDEVEFVSRFGTPDPLVLGAGDHFVIDNLTVNVREPAIFAVVAFAALALALARGLCSAHAPAGLG